MNDYTVLFKCKLKGTVTSQECYRCFINSENFQRKKYKTRQVCRKENERGKK